MSSRPLRLSMSTSPSPLPASKPIERPGSSSCNVTSMSAKLATARRSVHPRWCNWTHLCLRRHRLDVPELGQLQHCVDRAPY